MRHRKNDYLYEVTDEYEGFWSRSGYKARGFKYYHLIVKLNLDYNSMTESLQGLKPLENYLGKIAHYDSPIDEETALKEYESITGDDMKPYEGYGVINSKLHRKASGWVADLWLLRELEDWSLISICKK